MFRFWYFTVIPFMGVGGVLTFERSQLFKMSNDNIRLDKEWDEGVRVWSNVQGYERPYTTLISLISNWENNKF